MRFRLLPTDDRFFELFDDAATNVVACGRRLRELVEQAHPGGSATIEAVIACEQHGDELTPRHHAPLEHVLRDAV